MIRVNRQLYINCQRNYEYDLVQYRKLLEENQYGLVTFDSNKILLAERTLRQLIEVTREESPDTDIKIVTISNYIPKDTIAWINDYGVTLTVRVQLVDININGVYHPVNIEQFSQDYANILEAQNKTFEIVVTPNISFSDEIIKIHEIAPQTRMALWIYDMGWDEWTDDTINWLFSNLDKLYGYDRSCFNRWLNLRQFQPKDGYYLYRHILDSNGSTIVNIATPGMDIIEYGTPSDIIQKIRKKIRRYFKKSSLNYPLLDWTIVTNQNCNLRCTYCYECKNNQVNTLEDCKAYLNGCFKRDFGDPQLPRGRVIYLNLIGGEALLYPKLIDGILEHTRLLHKQYNCSSPFYAAISTNGTLISDSKDVQELLRKWASYIYLGISIDGIKETHDRCRIDHLGQGSYDKAVAGFNYFTNTIHALFDNVGTAVTYTHDNIDKLAEGVINLLDMGFYCVGPRGVYDEIWTKLEDGLVIAKQLYEVVDYLIDTGIVYHSSIRALNNDIDNNNWLEFDPIRKRTFNNCSACDMMRVLGPDKTIYGCHRFATLTDPIPIGKVIDDTIMISHFGHAMKEEIRNNFTLWPEDCQRCHFSGHCTICMAEAYETHRDNLSEWYNRKPVCGWTHATVAARLYLRNRLRELEGLPLIDDIAPNDVFYL